MIGENYQLAESIPMCIEWENYRNKVINEYMELIDNIIVEKELQIFLERNPSFVPGALGLDAPSGHYPYMHTVISQPHIGGIINRIPDFMWLAQDSLHFSPILIEIEKPSKKMFNQSGNTSADFNQALGQIKQWKYILNNPTNHQLFYDMYHVPQTLREKVFAPQYILVYGRRSEYEDNALLTGMRYENQDHDIKIISFDRLSPSYEFRQFCCCKMVNGEYSIKTIPPTFRYRPDCAEVLPKYKDFEAKIDEIEMISVERRLFLKKRLPYWIEFGKNPHGLIVSQEGE